MNSHHHHDQDHHSEHDEDAHHEHFVLPPDRCLKVFIALLVGTLITVAAARVDLGFLNFTVAMLIASLKAFLVVAFFMGMSRDSAMNRGIFLGGFVFVIIFFAFTAADLFTRPDGSFIKPSEMRAALAASKGDMPQELRFNEPWKKSDELMAWGKETYNTQCVACHGADGKGIAAMKSRNFTESSGWKKGRKPHQVVATLTNPDGLVGMANFSSLPLDQRWALAHYVLSFGPAVEDSTLDEIKKAGVFPGAQAAKKKTIPVDAAIELMASDGKLKSGS